MPKEKKQIDRNTTSVSLETHLLEECIAHAATEGLSFSKMVAALCKEDIAQKEASSNKPEKIIARYKLKKERLLKWGDSKSESNIKMIDEFIELLEKT